VNKHMETASSRRAFGWILRLHATTPKQQPGGGARLHVESAFPAESRTRAKSDLVLIAILLTISGIAALWFVCSRNEILLSGDAVAHINIARRVFDSRTPGPLQLGSVWLPLPHLLTIPFVISRRMWQTGLGGSIVSVASYVLAGMGLFRLLAIWSRLAAWIALFVFAANPNLLYVQTTALNEPIFLACFVWTLVCFTEAAVAIQNRESPGTWLEKGAIVLTAGVFTRYDGWFLCGVCWAAMIPFILRAVKRLQPEELAAFRRALFKALLLTALGPSLWLAYNFGAKGNALDFANGPYSAKAIAQRTTEAGAPPYPGENHPWTAGVYFAKAVQLNVGETRVAKLLVWMAVAGSLWFVWGGAWMPLVLLWSPLVFYALSIAYGSVPIFVPVWWPFSYYNVRYGLELLPAVAAGIGFLCSWISRLKMSRRWHLAGIGIVCVLVIISYESAWRATPVCLREVRVNGHARLELDGKLAGVLSSLPSDATILAYAGSHSGAFEIAAVPFRRTINEGAYLVWEASLDHPAQAADYVMASADDPLGAAVAKHPQGLQLITTLRVEGQSPVSIYKTSGSR
jgi:hypothetical protein